MRKEIVVAIIVGILVGLLVAFGSWRANMAINSTASLSGQESLDSSANDTDSLQKKETEPSEFTIALSNIDDYDVIQQSPLKISGITKPNSTIAISGENEDFIVKALADGTFSQEIKFVDGVNQVIFTAYTPEGNKLGKKLTVVYSPDFDKN